MRRLFSLAALLLCSATAGVTFTGCHKGNVIQFCNGGNSGNQVGQIVSVDLEPRLTGLSLNQGQIGTISRPLAKDCNGSTVPVTNVTYSSNNLNLLDINPATGSICAGHFNRNTGGGIADFTTCTSTGQQGTAYVTATAGIGSNAIPVYVHPVVASIVLGPASVDCAHDPATNCSISSTAPNNCGAPTASAQPNYDGTRCISQGGSAQLAARVYSGDVTNPANNISCLVGPITFSALTGSIVAIDPNGLATARQPGLTTISASTSQSSSTAGFFSTCPPKSIVLTTPGLTAPPGTPVTVAQNNTQNLLAIVTDVNGNPINNLTPEYVSTSPTTVPAAGSAITPTFPGAAAISEICQPPQCNSAPVNQIGLFGNGIPVTSNPVSIHSVGSGSSTVLYIASTNSQYVLPVDFTVTNAQTGTVKLPYTPNSMVISQDGSTIYMGSTNELMIFNAITNALVREDLKVAGRVLAVSPDGATVVITDPVRKLVYLYNPSGNGAISSQYGGVGTRAEWTPDSKTIYVATDDGRLLVNAPQIGWTEVPLGGANASDVVVTVPTAGVYVGVATGPGTVTARTNCPITTVSGVGLDQTTTNVFYPVADNVTGPNGPVFADRLVATNDGLHILGASFTSGKFTDIVTNAKSGGCPVAFTSTVRQQPLPLAGSGINQVIATSDSAFAFVTNSIATAATAGGSIEQYVPGTGALTSVTLPGAGVPVFSAFSADNQNLYVGTSGDTAVHLLKRGTAGFTDSPTPIQPKLPAANGTGFATPDLLVQRPRTGR